MGMAENYNSIIDRKENKQKILQKVRPDFSLEFMTKMKKMLYLRHVVRAHLCLEKYIMLGITGGAKKKGEALYAVNGRDQNCSWTLSK